MTFSWNFFGDFGEISATPPTLLLQTTNHKTYKNTKTLKKHKHCNAQTNRGEAKPNGKYKTMKNRTGFHRKMYTFYDNSAPPPARGSF